MTKLRKFFWKKYTVDQLSQDEWEALCDGCAKCCLLKIVNKKKFLSQHSCSKLELRAVGVVITRIEKKMLRPA